jgi:hypothetical protein
MKHDIFNGAGISAQIAKGMALAFFARAFEELAGHLAPHGGAKLPEVIDPAAEHAAFTLACDLRIKNDATDLAQLYERARVAHRTGEGFAGYDARPIRRVSGASQYDRRRRADRGVRAACSGAF